MSSLTTTQFLFKLTLVTMPQEVPHGKPMGDSFKRPMNRLKHYGKLSLHKCFFFTKLRKIVKYYKHFYLAKGAVNQLEDIRLKQHLEIQQIVLHSDTMNGIAKARIKIFRNKLQSLVYKKEEGCRIRSRT